MTYIDSPLQMSLGVSLKDDATFDNFYVVEANAMPLDVLGRLGEDSFDSMNMPYLVWGSHGSGLTHLLQAICHGAHGNKSVQYLPLIDMLGFSPADICEGLESTELVCLDGIDVICGHREWERAIFHLYNNLRDAGHMLVMSSHLAPQSLPVALNDLKSRVLASMFLRIESLSDDSKQEALIMRAKARGMDMPQEVARYILSRAPRDTNILFNILDRLDDASLQQQRKLTIPFVKTLISV